MREFLNKVFFLYVCKKEKKNGLRKRYFLKDIPLLVIFHDKQENDEMESEERK